MVNSAEIQPSLSVNGALRHNCPDHRSVHIREACLDRLFFISVMLVRSKQNVLGGLSVTVLIKEVSLIKYGEVIF